MKYLIEIAMSYGLESVAAQLLEDRNVHGIIIDLHPAWLYAYSQHLRHPDQEIDLEFFRYYNPFFYRSDFSFFEWPPTYFNVVVPIDIRWRPAGWSAVFGEKSNLIVRAQYKPASEIRKFPESSFALTVQSEYASLPEFSSNTKKTGRPLQGGLSIGSGIDSPGTLGGILRDKTTRQLFGLSCGHVIRNTYSQVSQPSMVDDNSSNLIGECNYSVVPKPSVGYCNPYSDRLNEMDIALIKLDPEIKANHAILDIGDIRGITPANELHPNLKIEFTGRSSGHRTLVTGGIGFVQQITDSQTGETSCFKNLIEIKQPRLSSLLLRRPVKGGDSGAWLATEGNNGLEWCGMIIGQNRQAGYAIHSQDILEHLKMAGYDLDCYQ